MVFPELPRDRSAQLPESLRNSPELKPLLSNFSGQKPPTIRLPRRSPPSDGARHYRNVAALDRLPEVKTSFATIGQNVRDFVRASQVRRATCLRSKKPPPGIGALNWLPDHDQILRRIPLVVSYRTGSTLRSSRKRCASLTTPRRSACVRPATVASPAIEASRRSPSVKPSFRPIVMARSGYGSRGTIQSARFLPLTCSRARRRERSRWSNCHHRHQCARSPRSAGDAARSDHFRCRDQRAGARAIAHQAPAQSARLCSGNGDRSRRRLGVAAGLYGLSVGGARLGGGRLCHRMPVRAGQLVGVFAGHAARRGISHHDKFGRVHFRDRIPLLRCGKRT